MTQSGYYHSPTLHRDTVVFVSEDDLWHVSANGGLARRLTANSGMTANPALSPDGEWLAFSATDEGAWEVYLMPALGGDARRQTFLGADSRVIGWTPDSQQIVFVSNHAQYFEGLYQPYRFKPNTLHSPQPLPSGPAQRLSFGPDGGMVIVRHTDSISDWKRYRGGLTGDLWIDLVGNGDWQRLIDLNGNVTHPIWLGERIYFVADHEGIGNLYSCNLQGLDLQRHTHHQDFYVRQPATDGQRIVYQAGADLHIFNPQSGNSNLLNIQYYSSRVQRKRKFVNAPAYLEYYNLHPQGHSLAITTRGKAFTMANWEQAVLQHGQPDGVHYRLATWLYDGQRLVVISDESGEERLEIHPVDTGSEPQLLSNLDLGRPIVMVPAPNRDLLAIGNHRFELLLVDLSEQTITQVDRSPHDPITDITWSPDDGWLAYSFSQTAHTTALKLYNLEAKQAHTITKPVLRDVSPAFDPDGKYLYFLSYRTFNPVPDQLHFEWTFPWGMKPCLITLQANTPSPFDPQPRAPGEKGGKGPDDHDDSDERVDETDDETDDEEAQDETLTVSAADDPDDTSKAPQLAIDLEGIADRVILFPVDEGQYGQIAGLKGRAIFTGFPPLEPNANLFDDDDDLQPTGGLLLAYDLEELEIDELAPDVDEFALSLNGRTLVYRNGRRLRVVKAGDKVSSRRHNGRKSGWIDLYRINISIDPPQEWRQMLREAWRLQRDYFWDPAMSSIDWEAVYRRYAPLMQRVGSRREFADLLTEMQGELGTSHTFEYGGDYPYYPHYAQGFLGVDFSFDPKTEGYFINRIVRGDDWDAKIGSPLVQPGSRVQEGDLLLGINGRPLSAALTPQMALTNQANQAVKLSFGRAETEEVWETTVTALADETPLRYRAWVNRNRAHVHQISGGRLGYVHIPDMSRDGYAEFHRGYLAEVDRDGLIVDVRYNRGGKVSSLILEKLARKRLGYDISRWRPPTPYPPDSVFGPIIALCNEWSASDGDMFSYAFKAMQLGPLVGVRTWGGVIGYSLADTLVDGGLTTQPGYAIFFNDAGYSVENYGVDPDIAVDIRPQDYVAGDDPQLARAIVEGLRLLAENPPTLPDFQRKPALPLPTLPPID